MLRFLWFPQQTPERPSAGLITQMRDQKNWSLPMLREHDDVNSGDAVLDVIRLLSNGQHDRHGGRTVCTGGRNF